MTASPPSDPTRAVLRLTQLHDISLSRMLHVVTRLGAPTPWAWARAATRPDSPRR